MARPNKKETYYFSHDYGARHDPNMVKLFMKEGMAGIGIYWCLVEMLYEQNGMLKTSECDTYAFGLRTECEQLKRVINDYGLFAFEDGNFYSESVNRRLKIRAEKSEKASNSAHIRWNNANAMQTQSEGNAIKESKVKEKKGNVSSIIADIPTIQVVKSFFKDNNINGAEADKFFKYNQKRGWKIGNQKIADWKLVAEGWIKNIEEPAQYVSELRKYVKTKLKECETRESLLEIKQKVQECDDWKAETKDEQDKILRAIEDKWTYDIAFKY